MIEDYDELKTLARRARWLALILEETIEKDTRISEVKWLKED